MLSARAVLSRCFFKEALLSICFIAFVWTRRLIALSIIASIRSSIPMSCSIASSVNKTEAQWYQQSFRPGPKRVAAGNKFDDISH